MMLWWGHDGDMGVGGWVGMVFMIVFWIAVIIGIIYLVRYLAARPRERDGMHMSEGSGSSDPLRTLENRYASGEIDREEYLQRRKDLEHKSG